MQQHRERLAKWRTYEILEHGPVADIMRLLRAQTVDAGDVIVRSGDHAHSMYFVAAGEVDIALAGKHIRLAVGHFFGEIAVLRPARRSATVTATVRTNLLVARCNRFPRSDGGRPPALPRASMRWCASTSGGKSCRPGATSWPESCAGRAEER
jgi:Cyclic nucleotide-binding domain